TGLSAEKTARTNALAGTLAGRVAFDRLLREIALVIPDGVGLIQLSAQSPTATGAVPVAVQTAQPGSGPVQSFTIVGTTRQHETVALTLARLSVIPELSSVSLVNSTEDPRLGIVNFTIKASVRQGEPA
ncbi:MAG: PilN domain-containing protein, partial [Gaiellaceae bacterium]